MDPIGKICLAQDGQFWRGHIKRSGYCRPAMGSSASSRVREQVFPSGYNLEMRWVTQYNVAHRLGGGEPGSHWCYWIRATKLTEPVLFGPT